ncbi:MAG: hypothetical protein HXX10_21155 [Rhodoplanes sp.]|uniref:hypothetical protein n=1 Tax=Rhodoplanes sp. TaxID=1968906 RepID=UPI00185AA73F|nr:hypothetical protein [Rhodoplanes sp.]NVO16544.1 hypothetical protein [Rhodoplanes sp.]
MSDPQDASRDPRPSDSRPVRNPSFADRNLDPMEDAPARRGGSPIWAWLAGIAAAVFIIAIVYGFSDIGAKDVAFDRNAPAATTGSSSGAAPPAGSGMSRVPGTAGPASEGSAPPSTPEPAR